MAMWKVTWPVLNTDKVDQAWDLPEGNQDAGMTRGQFIVSATAVAALWLLWLKHLVWGSSAEAADLQTVALQRTSLEYTKLADKPVDQMLRDGESEWFSNPAVIAKYGERAPRVWEKSIVNKVWSWELRPRTVKLLEEYTPKMLVAFWQQLSESEKYLSLYAAWLAYISKLNEDALKKLTTGA